MGLGLKDREERERERERERLIEAGASKVAEWQM